MVITYGILVLSPHEVPKPSVLQLHENRNTTKYTFILLKQHQHQSFSYLLGSLQTNMHWSPLQSTKMHKALMLVTGKITSLDFSFLTGITCCGLQLVKLSEDTLISASGCR